MKRKKILIVEDEPAILEAMQMILEDAGYEVEMSINGQIIQEIQEDVPAVFILDIWLSGMDGKEICTYLKNQERTKQIPIIFCSANKYIKQIALEAGADDFIAKPFEMSELLAKVEKAVNHLA